MTMLMHPGSRFKPASHASRRRDVVGLPPADAQLAAIKRFFLCVLAALLAGGAVAGVIAIRTAAYFWRFPY
jgi:hypothetical protein